MIDTLLQLLDQQIDEATRQMADLAAERQRLVDEQQRWQQFLHTSPDGGLSSVADIQGWLRFGQHADRELKKLEEKDFLVEERISECRTQLLSLNQRKEMLEKVLERRELAEQRVVRRRQERDYNQRGVARRAVREAEGELWH